jgi:magnesium transporter
MGKRKKARAGGVGRHLSHRSRKVGLPPGSLVYIGAQTEARQSRITAIEYEEHQVREREVRNLDELLPLKPAPVTTWINVDGVHDAALLAEFGQAFSLDSLLMEDILNTDQRSKYEYIDNRIYVILKMFDFDTIKQEIRSEQVSLVVGPNFLITFQEEVGNEFDHIRERLRNNGSRLRQGGSGFLAYILVDVVIDRYFLVLENIGHALESLEDTMLGESQPDMLQQVHQIKRELIFFRKHLWPVRETISNLRHADTELLTVQTQHYLRDVHDHIIQAIDTLETYRDLISGIQELYLSVLSNRMNEIMKVLTIISTIFIPLTFIVGVYGMNFKYMPELEQVWAYPTIWLIMLLIAALMLAYFRRKQWI